MDGDELGAAHIGSVTVERVFTTLSPCTVVGKVAKRARPGELVTLDLTHPWNCELDDRVFTLPARDRSAHDYCERNCTKGVAVSSHVIQENESFRWVEHGVEGMVDGTRLEVRRRTLQIALGALWLVDAALQFQPSMFTKGFVTGALEPTASGNPWLLYRPMLWADHFMIHGIAWWNALFAITQLLIALGLFWRPTVRWALGGSMVWGVAVWWFAEGFGGVFSGSSPLSGEPGAVLLYVLVAALVWPTDDRDAPSVVDSSAWGRRVGAAVWVLVWGNFAVYFMIPANRAAQGLHDLVAGMSSGEPRWVQSMNGAMAGVLNGRGVGVSVGFALLCAFVALAIAAPSYFRVALVAALAFAAVVWVAQDFGGVFTSQGTDVNSGPLIALLAWTYWPLTTRHDPTPR